MADPISATLLAVSSLAQGRAQQQAGEYQAAVARNNQTIANENATLVQQQGATMVQAKQQQTAQKIGAVIAGAGASGVDPTSGSALRDVGDTAAMGATDALTIRTNAANAAAGYTNQGLQFGAQAEMDSNAATGAMQAGFLNAFSSFAGNTSTVGSKWTKPQSASANVNGFMGLM